MAGGQRFCTKCGHDLHPEAQFCTSCGTAVGPPARPPTQLSDWPSAGAGVGPAGPGGPAAAQPPAAQETGPAQGPGPAMNPGAMNNGPATPPAPERADWPRRANKAPPPERDVTADWFRPSPGQAPPDRTADGPRPYVTGGPPGERTADWARPASPPRPERGSAWPPSGPDQGGYPPGPGGYPPGDPGGYPPLPPADYLPGEDDLTVRRSSRLPLFAALGAAVVVILVIAIILVVHPFGHHTAAPPAAGPSSSSSAPSHSSGSPSPGSARQQAAQRLGTLLGQSVTDRNSVNAAYTDVQGCGPNLASDAQVFQKAAASRQKLLSQLGSLPGRSALPAPMLSDLTSAWQASVQADTDFAAWAQDESHGCKRHHHNAHLAAANGPDRQATTGKANFLRRWNPLASQYHLTTYQQNEL